MCIQVKDILSSDLTLNFKRFISDCIKSDQTVETGHVSLAHISTYVEAHSLAY